MMDEQFNDEKLRGILNQKVTSKISGVGKDLIEFRSGFQQSAQTIIDNVGTLLSSLEDELLVEFRAELGKAEELVRSRLEPELRNSLAAEAQQRFDQELQEQLGAARRASAEAEHEKFQSKVNVLSGSLREICQQQAQVEILTCFLDKAAIFAERVAFFVVKSGSIVGWQARGFEGEFRNESVRSLAFPPHVNNVFRQVADSKIPFRGSPLTHPELNELVNKFGSTPIELVYVVPLAVRGKTVAVLYADSGTAGSAGVDANALDILVTGVSLTVELSSARAKLGIKPGEVQSELQPAAGSAPGVAAPEKPASPPPPAQPKLPSVREEPGAPVSVLTETSAIPPLFHEPAVQEPAPVVKSEVPKAAEPYQPPQPPPPLHEPIPSRMPPPPPPSIETLVEAEQKLHNDARRFARLLVSEIKLYNEQKVLEGRRGKNLYDLLRDDIDKSRDMYEKRVAPEVSSKVDYFYEELVRILAENQVQTLGGDCPGPVILSR